MNTKSMPAVLALLAGLVICIMSFIQRVDTAVFAKRFIIVCIIFYLIGSVVSVIIHMNFKEMTDDKTDENAEDEENVENDIEDEQENTEETKEFEES